MPTKKKPAVEPAAEPKFTKEALMNSKRFHYHRDLVAALLNDGVEYTVSEVGAKIAEYLKGKVK